MRHGLEVVEWLGHGRENPQDVVMDGEGEERKDLRMNEAPGLTTGGSGSKGCSLTTVLRYGGC